MELTKNINGVDVKISISEEEFKNLSLQKRKEAAPNKVVFELSMPKNNAWNGRWSGQDMIHALIMNKSKIKNLESILAKKDFTYDFGDGWVAKITVKLINSYEAAQVKKANKGFCGYDWMVQSIINHEEIRCD